MSQRRVPIRPYRGWLFSLILCGFFLPQPLTSQDKLLLRLDLKDPKSLKLSHFRAGPDPFKANVPPYPPNRLESIHGLRLGPAHSEGFQELKEKLKGIHFIDVDLRQESTASPISCLSAGMSSMTGPMWERVWMKSIGMKIKGSTSSRRRGRQRLPRSKQ